MKSGNRNIRLGLFVILATVLLILALYFIGSKQNLFGNTFRISAGFYDVNGLMQGNNVRFAGIDVGTVESIDVENDSTVRVVMVIEKKMQPFIRQNAIASIGTEGLMGNKLVNINSGSTASPIIQEGNVLQSLKPLEMDEMVRTLNVTNENIKVITTNLRSITDKINSKNSLWSLLMDTVVAENVKSAIVNLKLTSNNAILITGNLRGISEDLKSGKGAIGALISDTVLSTKIQQTVVKLEKISDTAAVITGDISSLIKKLKRGEGTAGVLLNDTNLVHNLNKSVQSIDKGASSFDENMVALRSSWPFKKYFKHQKKPKKP